MSLLFLKNKNGVVYSVEYNFGDNLLKFPESDKMRESHEGTRLIPTHVNDKQYSLRGDPKNLERESYRKKIQNVYENELDAEITKREELGKQMITEK